MIRVVIQLGPQEVERAHELAAEIYERVKARPNYTDLTEPSRYEHGYLGEFAVSHWLEREGVAFAYSIDTSGSSQASEFQLNRIGRLEVKTASKPLYRHFMMPASQLIDFKIAVGVRLDGTRASIMGWIGSKDCPQMDIRQYKIPTRCIAFEHMRQPDTLLNLVRRLQRD